MKAILFSLTTLGVLTASCNKDKDSPSGPNVNIPNFNLVGPEGFKNTAKNGGEVATHLKTTSQAADQIRFSNGTATTSASRPSSLDSSAVKSFLAGETETPADISVPIPSEGTDCAGNLNFLNSVFKSTSEALEQAADALVKLDSNSLPEGVVREPSSEQYAVSYSMDLSKMKMESSTSGSEPATTPPTQPDFPQPTPTDPQFPLPIPTDPRFPQPTDPQNPQPITFLASAPGDASPTPMKVNGLARLGAGANDDLAILGLGFSAFMSDNGMDANANGGFVMGAYSKEQKLVMNLNSSVNASFKNPEGKSYPANLSATSSAVLTAGAAPSVELSFNSSGTAMVSGFETSQPSQNPHKVILDEKNHTMEAKLKIGKLANNDVSFSMTVKADGQEQKADLILTTNENGQCVVKQPGTATIATVK